MYHSVFLDSSGTLCLPVMAVLFYYNPSPAVTSNGTRVSFMSVQ
jgi:hypothetical protein